MKDIVSNKSQELGGASRATHKMPLDARYDLKGSRTIECEILCKRDVEVKQYHTRNQSNDDDDDDDDDGGRRNNTYIHQSF